MSEPSAADLRAVAVDRLKRAASLPRLKDGRRPPLKGESGANSENEKTRSEGGGAREEAEDASTSSEIKTPPNEKDKPDKAPNKRRGRSRSRSRSRSRTSRDYKEAALQSGDPRLVDPLSDEQLPPIPAHITSNTPPAPLFRPTTPHAYLPPPSPFLVPPRLSPTPLDALRNNLGRSNSSSAIARRTALHKLTGGKESPEPSFAPTISSLGRSNTVTGSTERVQARNILFAQLKRRQEAEMGTTTVPEEPPTTLTTDKTKLSAPSRLPSNPVVDDRDSSLPNSPTEASITLPSNTDSSPSSSTAGQDLVAINDSFQYHLQPPNGTHEPFTEDDELDDFPMSSRAPFLPLPPSREGSSPRLPHSSDAPSTTSSNTTSMADRIPVFLQEEGQKSPFAQDAFPVTISPYGTPSKDRTQEEEEEEGEERVVFPQDMGRKVYMKRSEREVNDNVLSTPPRHPIQNDIEYDEDDIPLPQQDDTPTRPGASRSSSKISSNPSSDNVPDTPSSAFISTPSSLPTPDIEPHPHHSASSIITPTRLSNTSVNSAMNLPIPGARSSPFGIQSGGASESFTDLEDLPNDTETDREREKDRPVRDREHRDRDRRDRPRVKESSSVAAAGWRKVKQAVSRSGSAMGRRSRSNSLVSGKRDEKTESAASRESGASLTSGKGGDGLVQIVSVSSGTGTMGGSSLLPLPSPIPPREGVSPVPPLSPASMAKYADDPKLAAFPGIVELEKASRTRNRGQSLSSQAVPDGLSPSTPGILTMPSTRRNSPEQPERGLSHQLSDSLLLARYQAGQQASGQSNSYSSSGSTARLHESDITTPGSRLPTVPAYIDIPRQSPPKASSNTTGDASLPMNREGVRKWLKVFSSQASLKTTAQPVIMQGPGVSSGTGASSNLSSSEPRRPTPTVVPGVNLTPTRQELRQRDASGGFVMIDKVDDSPLSSVSPSRSNSKGKSALREREKEREGSAMERDQARTPTLDLSNDPFAGPAQGNIVRITSPPLSHPPTSVSTSTTTSATTSITDDAISNPSFAITNVDNLLIPPPSSTKTDRRGHSPSNSLSHSSGTSTTTSLPATPPDPYKSPTLPQSVRSSGLLSRLDSLLATPGSFDQIPAAKLDDPPRKLLLASNVLQVVNQNTVKDRFLFLFTDLLVIAKPVIVEEDPQRDAVGHSLDRHFLVKSVVELNKLQLKVASNESSSVEWSKIPAVQTFVQMFAQNPDMAISTLVHTTGLKDDPATIGNILFRTVQLDKNRLGEYLSRRSSKAVLKTFLDRFGFTGVRIDLALRIFLLSIRLPTDAPALEYLLITFASRWFEVNKGVVTFDKDLATRLVFAMVQLNNALHTSSNADPSVHASIFSPPNHAVTVREFIDSFRTRNSHSLVSDDFLEKIYHAIRKEKLVQSVDPMAGTPARQIIVAPSRIPDRLTTRTPSDPIVIKIPQPDPNFGVHLQGQDLIFEPPRLNFSKSAEASFRVIGGSLGTKTAIMARTGVNAGLYQGLPLSTTFHVERAFMRNTLTTEFVNHLGVRRKYMFSIDEATLHEKWTSALRTQIADSIALRRAISRTSSDLRLAAESVALQVLRDAVITMEDSGSTPPQGKRMNGNGYSHQRSQSKSITQGGGGNSGAGPLKGHDLVLICQQNSLVPAALSALDVIKPAPSMNQQSNARMASIDHGTRTGVRI